MKFNETVSVKIPNYLLNLDDKIMIVDGHKPLIDTFKTSGLTYSRLAKELNMHNTVIGTYLRNEKPIPIYVIKGIVKYFHKKELPDEIFRSTNFYTVKNYSVKLPKTVTPKLAYYVGYLQGDGYISCNKKRYGFDDEYEQQMHFINQLTYELFNATGTVYERNNGKKPSYALTVWRYVIHCFLHKVFEMPIGIKNDLKIPLLIKKNKELLRWYLRGLFDADGTLPKKPKEAKQLFIDIALKDLSFIKEIRNSMKLFNIKTLEPYARKSKSPNSNRYVTMFGNHTLKAT